MTAINMIKILQGSVVRQTMLDGITVYPEVANFLGVYICKNNERWLTTDKVIVIINGLSFWPTLYIPKDIGKANWVSNFSTGRQYGEDDYYKLN